MHCSFEDDSQERKDVSNEKILRVDFAKFISSVRVNSGPAGTCAMKDKYLSKGLEGDLPTQPSTKPTASRIVFLPKCIRILLIVLLVCVSSHICSETFAEEQAMVDDKNF